MLLSDRFVERAAEFSELRAYRVRKEQVTYVYFRVYLESPSIVIRLDIEEMESYVSFLVSHQTPDGTMYYTALDGYPSVGAESRRVFETEEEERAFVEDFKRSVRNHRKLFTRDKHGDQIVTCIYTFLNGFVKKIA